jgi:cyanocobalamin reductase (cyanide-eliminating) / alkylcobalamin dealkylase
MACHSRRVIERDAIAAGFDLIAPVAIEAGDAPLPTFGRARARGLVIGNTRALWPRFVDAVAHDATLARDPDPLDRYTERVIAAIAPAGAACFFAHVREAHGYLPIQQLAERAGLATLAPSGLCVHPVYGPWIALRALIVVDEDGPITPAPRAVKTCACATGCEPAAARARAGAPFDPRTDSWRAWAEIRLACPLGREHQYPDDQLRYHYTRDLSLLRRAGR